MANAITESPQALDMQQMWSCRVTHNGVSCLEVHCNSNMDNVSSKQRKRDKDTLGKNNLEIPLLDIRSGENDKKEMNDAIVYTERVKMWDEAIVRYYEDKGYIIESRDLNGGADVLRAISVQEDQPLVTISFYDNTQKFMIQPGNRNQDNIMLWLADFAIVRKNVPALKVPNTPTVDNDTGTSTSAPQLSAVTALEGVKDTDASGDSDPSSNTVKDVLHMGGKSAPSRGNMKH